MQNEPLIIDFIQTLSDLNEKLKSLSDTLIEEQQALSQHDYELIETLAQRKLSLTQEINQKENKRITLCNSLQIKPDKASLQKWLVGNPVELRKTIAKLWQRIAYLGQKCETQNKLNGILVHHQERHTREALSILRGAIDVQDGYSEKGAHDSKTSTHVIAKA